MLRPGGALAQRFERFESRPQQLEMAHAVETALREQQHLFVEAGTGVGKSFAYLVPAIVHVKRYGGRVVVSTHTIALQEQLMEKDIPFLREALPVPFEAVLVKGRNNYLGLRRLERTTGRWSQLLADARQADDLWRIRDWANDTRDGSLASLSPAPDAALWSLVRSEHNDCLGRKCPHYRPCFYQRARRRAGEADVLIVNHALLFSDVAVRESGGAILPDYDYLVLDEAHTVPEVAASHFGISLSETQIEFLLNALYNPRTQRGVLVALGDAETIHLVQEARNQAGGFFAALAEWAERSGRSNGRLLAPVPVPNPISASLLACADALALHQRDTVDEQEISELQSVKERCDTLAAQLTVLHEQRHDGWVYWLEKAGRDRRRLSMVGRPLHIGPLIRAHLLDRLKCVVATSATLATAVEQPFAYLAERMGADGFIGRQVGSPFDYRQQVTLYIREDLPDPDMSEGFLRPACEAILHYLSLSRGRAFVLFTSYAMMNECVRRLEPALTALDMPLLVQGAAMPRTEMLNRFRVTPRCVLFGTDTFWSGVDVPGDALGNVIIVKLPFAAPDAPMVEARIEHMRSTAGNPFMDYQLPEAVLKFKQGFGRLIRTRTDRGMVVVLDGRIVRKQYGRRFLQSLPDCTIIREKGLPRESVALPAKHHPALDVHGGPPS